MYDENKHISLMENFNRQKFQWVKTKDQSRLAKVVTCVDIVPAGRSFTAKFDDGSSIDVSKISSDLMMITADMPPLSKSEVMSINGPVISERASPGSGPIALPPDLLKEAEQMRIESEKNRELQSVTAIEVPRQNSMLQPTHPSQQNSNMFSVFSAEESSFPLNLSLRLPDRKLLKMMYASAEDKEKFVSELSDFVLGQINKKVVADSLIGVVSTKQKG